MQSMAIHAPTNLLYGANRNGHLFTIPLRSLAGVDRIVNEKSMGIFYQLGQTILGRMQNAVDLRPHGAKLESGQNKHRVHGPISDC